MEERAISLGGHTQCFAGVQEMMQGMQYLPQLGLQGLNMNLISYDKIIVGMIQST